MRNILLFKQLFFFILLTGNLANGFRLIYHANKLADNVFNTANSLPYEQINHIKGHWIVILYLVYSNKFFFKSIDWKDEISQRYDSFPSVREVKILPINNC